MPERRRNSRRAYEDYSRYTDRNAALLPEIERERETEAPPRIREVRRRKRKPEARKISMTTLVMATLAAGLVALTLMQYSESAQINDETVRLKSQLSSLRAENIKIEASLEKKYSRGELESFITGNLGMIKPESGMVKYIITVPKDSAEIEKIEQKGVTGAAEGLLSKVQESCTDILDKLS